MEFPAETHTQAQAFNKSLHYLYITWVAFSHEWRKLDFISFDMQCIN